MSDLDIQLLPLQSAVLALPDDVGCLFLAGSKGSGKTTAAWMKLAQHIQRLRGQANVIVARTSFPALLGPLEDSYALWSRMGMRPEMNRHNFIISFPAYGGAKVRFMCAEDRQSVLERTSGMSITALVLDEAQNWPDSLLPLLLVGCVRAPPGIPTLVILTANPGGLGGSWCLRFFVSPAERLKVGEPFTCEAVGSRKTVVFLSSFRANRFIDREQYYRSLVAAAGGNSAYLSQIADGEFHSATGNFFELTPRSFIDFPDRIDWREYPHLTPRASLDWGSTSPYCISFALRVDDRGPLPCGRVLARGSYAFVSELTSADEMQGWTRAAHFASVAEIAGTYLNRCESLGLSPLRLAADAAIFAAHGSSQGSLSNEFHLAGVSVFPAPKPLLRTSFPALRERVWNASSDDVLPCVVFARKQVPYHVAAFEGAPTAANNVETVSDTWGLMHALDSARYLYHAGTAATVTTQPMFPANGDIDRAVREVQAYAARKKRIEYARKLDGFRSVPGAKLDLSFLTKEGRAAATEKQPPFSTVPIVRGH